MGEKKAAGKNSAGEKKDAGGAGPQPIVLKVDLHCAGCASKVRKAIKHAPGAFLVRPGSSFRGGLFLTVSSFVLCAKAWIRWRRTWRRARWW
jgi:hypothetical protein